MSELICNLPAQKVYVRKEYLRDLEDGFGEFVDGVWVSCKSIPGRAFYFETYLPQYGALFPSHDPYFHSVPELKIIKR